MAKGASARAAARKQRDKWKAKRWYTIRAPRTPWSFRVIGETLAEDPSQLIGRNYEIIQNELDGDFSKMHVKVVFKVTDVLGNDAITEFVGHELLKDHVRRQVRRDRGKIDDTIDVVTEDGYYIRFKPLMISRARIKSSQKQQMRAIARDIILTTGATSTWFKLQTATLDGTLENKIKEVLEKIETAIEPKFQDHFVAANAIPHKLDSFPELHKIVSLPKVHFNLGSENKTRRRRKRS